MNLDRSYCNNFECKDRGECNRYIGNYEIYEELILSMVLKTCSSKCELFVVKEE